MAEQIQTYDTSQLTGVISSTPKVVDSAPLKNQSTTYNTSELTGVTSQSNNLKTYDTSNLTGVVKQKQPVEQSDTYTQSYVAAGEEPSFWEKLAYGIDKQNQFFGNVFRVSKAGIEAAFDPDREFKEVALANAANEQAALYNRHQKFRNGQHDDDWVVKAAEFATFMLDPYYLLAYMTPWGRAATVGTTGVKATLKFAGLSGGTVGLDKLFENLATTGEVKPTDVAVTTTAGAVLGPLSVKAFRAIGKLLPSADKKQIANVLGVIEGQTAKKLGLDNKTYRTLQKIASDKEFLNLNKQVKQASDNWIKPIAKEQDIFYNQILKLDKKISRLKRDKRLIEGKGSRKKKQSISEKIATIEANQKAKKKLFDESQRKLWKKQSIASKKVIDLTADRDIKFLERLWKEKSLTEKTAQIILTSSVRPLMGGAVGYGFGKLWGPDDANLSNWFLTGATLGAVHKGIMASKILPGQSKNMIQRLLYQDATKMAFQKVRELTSTTTSSKLRAIGGDTEKIGLQLLENIDSSVSKFSITRRADDLYRTWQRNAFKIVAPYSADEQALALAIVRGSKAKASTRVRTLATNLEKEISKFKKLYNQAGIFSLDDKGKLMNVKDYFPRVWNFDAIKKDPEKFEKVIYNIFRSLGKNEKKAKSLTLSFANSLKNADESVINREAYNNLIDGVGGVTKRTTGNIVSKTPLSDHITKRRILNGPYAKVEKILNENGYLVNDIPIVLQNLYNRSMKSIAFAERFGANGQFLKPYIQGIAQKYKKLYDAGRMGVEWKDKAAQEVNLITKTIDAYFERHGKIHTGTSKSVAGILATISNLNMLDRVTIASLGDLAQPFTNSNNFTSFFRGMLRTGFTNYRERGQAKNMNLALNNEITNNLLKSHGVTSLDNAANAANTMGSMGPLRKANELGFKVMGLQWLTGLARRYAYNVGAVDAYTSASKFAKFASANPGKINSSKGLKLIRDLNRYGLNIQDGLKIGKFKTFDDAVTDKTVKRLLNDSGILAANRDALIPQVSNRLLFAQSRNPWVRLMGQFTSWAMAKSTQTNRILSRIENGDTRQLVKLLAALPVYGGIQQLREIAKYGEIKTDPSTQEGKWWSEALRLSGMGGILPELFIGRLTGPGSYQPWFLPFPAASVSTDVGLVAQDTLKGNTDKAMERFLDKIVPFPTYRNWIMRLFGEIEPSKEFKGTNLKVDKLAPRQFNKGGIARQKFNIGKLAVKGLTKLTSKKLDKPVVKAILETGEEIAPDATAIPGTIGTYKKANKILTDLNVKSVHDFGSGLGIGTRQFTNKNVTSHEPFVKLEDITKASINYKGKTYKGKEPNYRTAEETILNEGPKSKDGVVNLNVLNVVASKLDRKKIVKDIGSLISDTGYGIITVRSAASVNAAGKASKYAYQPKGLDGWIMKNKGKNTFQKGYNQKELIDFVLSVLNKDGKKFNVEKIPLKYMKDKDSKITSIGVLISRINKYSVGGQVARLGLSGGDSVTKTYDTSGMVGVVSSNDNIDDQVTTMMEEEKVIVPEKKPIKTKENTVKEEDSFQEDLKLSESSNDYEVINTEGYMGAYQFGKARLQDYKDATGETFDNKTFVSNKELQDKVFKWHTNDIKSFVSNQKLDSYIGKKINGVPVTLNGLIAVAHLGGKEGMKMFLNSNGEYNPKDKYGTSLLDYLNKFK